MIKGADLSELTDARHMIHIRYPSVLIPLGDPFATLLLNLVLAF